MSIALCGSVTQTAVIPYLVIMSERLQQRGEVVEVDLLEVVSHCVDQAALFVSASNVLSWLCKVDYISNT